MKEKIRNHSRDCYSTYSFDGLPFKVNVNSSEKNTLSNDIIFLSSSAHKTLCDTLDRPQNSWTYFSLLVRMELLLFETSADCYITDVMFISFLIWGSWANFPNTQKIWNLETVLCERGGKSGCSVKSSNTSTWYHIYLQFPALLELQFQKFQSHFDK